MRRHDGSVQFSMVPTQGRRALGRSKPQASAAESRALEYLWQHLRDVPHPHVLDCGPICQSTADVLLGRGAKLFVADLLTPAQRKDAAFWSLVGKTPVFLIEDFLAQLPLIPPGSLSAVFCWHLLDLLPREALPPLVRRLRSFLHPGGALFCLLREPYLMAGAEIAWCLQSLTALGSGVESRRPFPYPAVTNREMERLVPSGSVKTFLTRAGRREVLAII
jgi:hypothetical protein